MTWPPENGSPSSRARRARHVRRRGLLFFAAAVSVVGCVLSAVDAKVAQASSRLASPPTVRVVFYGDSFTRSATPYLLPQFSTATTAVRIFTYPGSAPCDFAHIVFATTRDTAPTAVVFQFDGNGFTSCMKQYFAKNPTVNYVQATANKYMLDLTSYQSYLASLGTKYFVFDMGPVAATSATPTGSSPLLLTAYQNFVHHFKNIDVVYAAAADNALLTAAKKFTSTLPCLPVEISAGNCTGPTVRGVPSNVVRSPDGRHFCPVDQAVSQGVIPYCPVYSSGNFRFATAFGAQLLKWLPTARPVYPTPIVSRLSANSGSSHATHVVTLYGLNFSHVTRVAFHDIRYASPLGGNYFGTQLKIVSNTQMQVTVPAINLNALKLSRLTLSAVAWTPDSSSAYLALLALQYVAT